MKIIILFISFFLLVNNVISQERFNYIYNDVEYPNIRNVVIQDYNYYTVGAGVINDTVKIAISSFNIEGNIINF